jgi:hypothetical protein
MLASALSLGGARARDWPPWAAALVIALSARVLLSDVAHGNVNIVLGATVVAAAMAWSRGQDWRAGLAAGLGTALKVTPGLLLVYFAWKRSARGAGGWLAGVLLGVFVLPAPFVGPARASELALAWWRQMIAPFVALPSGAPVTLVQTEQINQSLLGVLARWTTDSVAIDSDPPLSINALSLSPGGLRALWALAALATLAALAVCLRPRAARRPPVVLGEFALLALAMLFLSERSWKHHWVLLMLPIAFLARETWGSATPSRRRIAWTALAASAVLHGSSGSAVLGGRGSDLAEAYGAYLWGGLALFAAVGWLLWSPRPAPQ